MVQIRRPAWARGKINISGASFVGRRHRTRPGLAGAGRERWASVSRTRPQATEQVDATANGNSYEEDLH
jgi:hypothetical protein